MASVHSGEESFAERLNPLSRVRQRYRQTTDGIATAKTRT